MLIVSLYFISVSVFFLSCVFFFFKQKTAYEMRISDWSSDVCSSDLSAMPWPGPESCARCVAGPARRTTCRSLWSWNDLSPPTSGAAAIEVIAAGRHRVGERQRLQPGMHNRLIARQNPALGLERHQDRKSTRLNYSH